MKRLRLPLLVALLLGGGLLSLLTLEEAPAKGGAPPPDLGHGVTVARECSLVVIRVPRRSGVRLRAVLASEKKPRLAALVAIAAAHSALAGVNGDYHGLARADFAQTYSPVVTDGRVSGRCRDGAYESFWLDRERVPHVGGEPPADAWLAIGTGPRLLEKGEVTRAVLENRTPGYRNRLGRTAVGIDGSTVFLATTAQEPRGGRSMEELALCMKELGCTDALALDGGPSSALVAGGRLANLAPGEEGRVNDVASALLVLEPAAGDPGVR